MSRPLIIGSRSSTMAQIMANEVRRLILHYHPEITIEMKFFSSQGDVYQGDLSKLGGKGAFVKDLELRLLSGEIDCAVHSLKDVPGDVEPVSGLEIPIFIHREDPRDALIMREGLSVPTTGEGLTLATSSPRRRAFLRKLYPQAKVIPLRGNVDTRLKKLQAGEFDGMVLALSGLDRLSLSQHVTKVYEPNEMLPAVGQGVMCVQIRTGDLNVFPCLNAVQSLSARDCVMAERALLRQLNGHCHAAIAGFCVIEGDERWLRGWVSDENGSESLYAEARQPLSSLPEDLGFSVAQELLSQNAARLIGPKRMRA